jgi:dTDP-D-glucose 4,6-dehydratase
MRTGAPRAPRQTILVTGGAGYIGSHACVMDPAEHQLRRLFHLRSKSPATSLQISHGQVDCPKRRHQSQAPRLPNGS